MRRVIFFASAAVYLSAKSAAHAGTRQQNGRISEVLRASYFPWRYCRCQVHELRCLELACFFSTGDPRKAIPSFLHPICAISRRNACPLISKLFLSTTIVSFDFSKLFVYVTATSCSRWFGFSAISCSFLKRTSWLRAHGPVLFPLFHHATNLSCNRWPATARRVLQMCVAQLFHQLALCERELFSRSKRALARV